MDDEISSQARKILVSSCMSNLSSVHYCDYTHQCSLMISSQAHLSTCINPAFNQAASTRTRHNYHSRRFQTPDPSKLPYSCLDGRRISIFDFHSKKSNRSRDSLFPILKFTNQKKQKKKKKEEPFRFSITIPSAQELSRYSAKKRKKKMSDFSKVSILEEEEEKERKKKRKNKRKAFNTGSSSFDKRRSRGSR